MRKGRIWIKLYCEFLHDPKMIRLGERLQLRAIQCFMLAGIEDRDGFLPPLEDCAVILRIDGMAGMIASDVLEGEFQQLAQAHVLNQVMGAWRVTHFDERQPAMPTSKERMRRLRKRRKVTEVTRHSDEGDAESDAPDSDSDSTRLDLEERRTDSSQQSLLLQSLGIFPQLADRLAREYPERVAIQADRYRWGIESGHVRDAGWLAVAIEEDWAQPDWYVPAEERCHECGQAKASANMDCGEHRRIAYGTLHGQPITEED